MIINDEIIMNDEILIYGDLHKMIVNYNLIVQLHSKL